MDRVRSAIALKARRWRATWTLLWRAGRWYAIGIAVLTLVRGLLPTGVILATGALVAAVPDAIEHGFGSDAGARVIWALAAVGGGFLVIGSADALTDYAEAVVTSRYTEAVHDTLARALLAPENVALLEDPAVAGEVAALEEYDRTGVHLRTVNNLHVFLTLRVQGLAALAILVGFAWWTPFVLLAGARAVNWTTTRFVEMGIGLGHAEGAKGLRRGNYLRQLTVEPHAAKEIRVFGLGGWVVGQYTTAWLAAMGEIWRGRAKTRWGFLAGGAALLASQASVIGAVGWSAANGAISVAALVVYAQAVMAAENLGPIGDAQWAIGRTVMSADHVIDLERRFAGSGRTDSVVRSTGSGPVGIRLEGVGFTYQSRQQPTLHDFDLTIPAGQSLAIVGENGVGKTTLIKLLCGLYEPDHGRVLLDGADDPIAVRHRIGVIFQDFVRYELPLRANVGFGSLELVRDEQKLRAALADAGAADLLDRLPAGWDTVLARGYDNGTDLSGGQWQKVALARALMAIRGGAGLLILDEPTANLDVRAEAELFDRFLELTKGVTTILVSHRLSSVRHADRIVVIADGRPVEDGSHDELVAAGGRYAQMYGMQASRFAEAGTASETTEEAADA